METWQIREDGGGRGIGDDAVRSQDRADLLRDLVVVTEERLLTSMAGPNTADRVFLHRITP
jgi:hypothetical protein